MKREQEMISELLSLKNRTVLITGGAGFLAATYAEVLSEAGANIVLADIKKEEVEKQAQKLSKNKRIIHGYEVDITNQESIQSLMGKIIANFGSIDVLINNAAINPKVEKSGLSDNPRFEDFPVEVWQRDLEVDLTGMYLISQSVVREMKKRKKGVIVNISSVYGLVSPNQDLYKKKGEKQAQFKPASYSASKAAVINFTRYLATYLAKDNIRVNCLAPGGVYQNQSQEFLKRYSNYVPMGRMANPSELAGPILFLSSDASSYMTGSTLVIDGGWTAW